MQDPAPPPVPADAPAAPRTLAPLYAAGFTTAFGAHGVAAAIGARSDDLGLALLTFGLLLAVYDLAEVVLKPVFGSWADRIGIRPVLVGGLLAFAAASLVAVGSSDPLVVGAARLGQGAAAAAFSPAASAAVARLTGPSTRGRTFGRYGSWKSLGYALGPLLGAGLVALGGLPALFVALAATALITGLWARVALPELPVLPRPRYTVRDLLRQTTDRAFLVPTLALAATTGALGVAVGFLPLLGTRLGAGVPTSMATVTVLALASSAVQPLVGRWHDDGRVGTSTGTAGGLVLVAAGLVLAALVPGVAGLFAAAAVLGTGIGTTTPLAFAHLAATTPHERMGRTMGSADVGRELGDAGAPLLVGAVATVASPAAGILVLATLVAGTAAVCRTSLRTPPH